MKSPYLILFILISINCIAAKQEVNVVKTTQPPVIDGKLDDACWTSANKFTGFITFIPDFEKPMPEKTEAWLSYDEENLYFAFKCYDSEPDKIKATVSARDQIFDDDFVCVNLDSHNDQQSLYAFYVNPLGIQGDSRFAAGTEDPSIDLVWYSAGKIDDDGYSVEISIPLKSIRFSKNDTVQMGLFLERTIARTKTHGSVPEMDPKKGYAFLTQFMGVNYAGINYHRLWEILPAVTYKHTDINQDGKMVKDQRKPEASLTVKYGITSDLVFDGTLNPDFSQVEADAGQIDVNLRYQLLYPEKRPFFLEGLEKFNVAATQTSVIDPIQMMVHTRTIVNPLTGAKLTGKIGKKDEVNILYSADELGTETVDGKNEYAHFPLFRYKRNLKNESFLGFLYTGREASEFNNRVLGADGQIRLNKSTMFEYNGFHSQTIVAEEKNPGNSFGLVLTHDTRNLTYKVSAKGVDEDFHVETGYVTRTGIYQLAGLLMPKIYPGNKVFNRLDFELFTTYTRDRIYNMNETYNFASAQVRTQGRGVFKIKYLLSNEIFMGERFNTGGINVLLGGAAGNWFEGHVVYRRMNGIYYSADPEQGKYNKITSMFSFQPLPKLNVEASFSWYDFRADGSDEKIYNYPIERLKVTYQFNKYLFLRGVGEYNGYSKEFLGDVLLSFTYIPGTVGHIGYGALYEQTDADLNFLDQNHRPTQQQRGFFIKLSYLIRS
ncbi:carbohydrate binding family 9 domain-containing protein [Maribellus sediminis]|uniref:carbohydrate binding family 9 domain-containing protein n=1 Tax=Maribellus sediminis TaxID=2696285 RepID=UPI0014309D1C|nr:carbohydrate binding family 9 domain-containing protein [Maribellus sediminis]